MGRKRTRSLLLLMAVVVCGQASVQAGTSAWYYDLSRNEIVQEALTACEQRYDEAAREERAVWDPPVAAPSPVVMSAAAPSSVFSSLDAAVHGEARVAVAMDSDGNLEFNRANADLNEKNYRLLSSEAFNDRSNTYDPVLYSRLKVVLDAAVASSIDMHMNVTVDPWSYTGKTPERTVTGSWGNDTLDVQYLFWGNTGYTVNQTLNTNFLGDGVALPEIKARKGHVPAASVTSSFGDTFHIPEMDIDTTFQPVRELWFDLKPRDYVTLRVFPMAYQDQALTSDDPMRLSNNKTWWEESPWLRDWQPGHLNTGVSPQDFTQGEWDRSLAFFTRDSDGTRLTALRGVTLAVDPDADTTLRATVAAPKTLWQEYSMVTAIPGSMRVKRFINEGAYIGGTANMHVGMVEGKKDAHNYVGSIDGGVMAGGNVKITGQVSASVSRNNILTSNYETKKRGSAYFVSIETASEASGMLRHDYYNLLPPPNTELFCKSRLYFGMMEEGFESSLSNYHETRDDSWWSRSLTFYPSVYRTMPGTRSNTSEDDQIPFAVGTGLDYGRKVVGWRGDTLLWAGKLAGMGDIRHVTTTDGRYIETVARTEWTYKATDRFTARGLFVAQDLPETVAGIDPFIVDGETGEKLANTAVTGGEDPSLTTTSVGARYQVTDWAAVNGVWAWTNDTTVGDDNFPRAVFNSSSFTTYSQDGRVYRKKHPFLYGQGYFDQAPYAYHNIFKGGVHLTPVRVWNIYVDYTRNPNKFAGNISDNMNHYGIELSYVPTEKFGVFARYTFSKWYDLNRLLDSGEICYRGYNNAFVELRYLPRPDEKLSLQYGVGPAYVVDISASNPQMEYYYAPVLSTQHIAQMVYEKKF